MKNILFLLMPCLLFSCSREWLEVKADKTLTLPTTLADFQGMLDNSSVMSQQYPALGEISSDGHYVSDAVFQSATKNFNTDAYIWSKTTPHVAVSTWTTSYARVLYCNIVIDGLKKLSVDDASEKKKKDEIMGQALFFRARSFFELMQIYTMPYDEQTVGSSLGIPLRTTIDITEKTTRSSLSQTRTQIIMDLEEAISLLSDLPDFQTRPSKASAYAMLARIYLCFEEYKKAALVATEALKIKADLLNFDTLPVSNNVIGRYNLEVILHSNLTPVSLITGNCLIEKSLYLLYNVNDLRSKIFFTQNTNGTISFKGNYDAFPTVLFNGLTTSELYLVRAECYAREGKITEAMMDLNKLLQSRWDKDVTFVPFTAANTDEALAMILSERKKELLLRGIRWLDLRRLNKDGRFAVSLERIVAGVKYHLEPESYKYAFPLPDDIVEQTGMRQNDGWEK